MRGAPMICLGVSAVMIAAVASYVPALADPVYTKEQLVKIFQKDKAKTRGITLYDDDAKAAAPENSATSATRVNMLVNFELDSANLTPSAKEHLNIFAAAVKDPRLKGSKFKIEGYTDATGAEAYNLSLSDRRARSVVSYLSSLGVDAGSLQAQGFGMAKPVDPDPYSPKNRRVEGYLAE